MALLTSILRARRRPDDVAKEYSSPTSATSGLAGYALEGQAINRMRSFGGKVRLLRSRRKMRIRAVRKGTSQDGLAHQAATSPYNLLKPPTRAQALSGGYRKGHIKVGPFRIAVENPAGSRRRPEWPELSAHYGYIKRTEGADGDSVDVFVRIGTPDDYAGPVWVIDQKVGGWFDEHKVMLGWTSGEDARKAYLRNYAPGWDGIGAITMMTIPEFKIWLRDGDTTRPVAMEKGVPNRRGGARLKALPPITLHGG